MYNIRIKTNFTNCIGNIKVFSWSAVLWNSEPIIKNLLNKSGCSKFKGNLLEKTRISLSISLFSSRLNQWDFCFLFIESYLTTFV